MKASQDAHPLAGSRIASKCARAGFVVPCAITPAGKVDEQSRLCQSYKVTPESREIRMPDKLRAIEQLVKLCGWNDHFGKKFPHLVSRELALLGS
jgi:hypothetical protein